MTSYARTVINSVLGIILSLSLISAFWLGSENRRMYAHYAKERMLWHQKNRELEFEVDKFTSELEILRQKMDGHNVQLSKVEEEKLISRERVKELADENKKLRDEVARLSRERENIGADSKGRQTAVGENSGDAFWSNLLREKVGLELRLGSMERLLNKKDSEIASFGEEKQRLNQSMDELLNKKMDLEGRIEEIKRIVASLSDSLEQEKNEKLSYAKKIKEMEDKESQLRLKLDETDSAKVGLEKKIRDLEADMKQKEEAKQKFQERLGHINRILEDEMLQVTQLKQDLETALQKIKNLSYAAESPAVELPAIEITDSALKGRIVSINLKENFVVIDIGRRDGASKGQELSVYRGNELIAKLQIIEVREVTAAAKILISLPQQMLAENDIVLIP